MLPHRCGNYGGVYATAVCGGYTVVAPRCQAAAHNIVCACYDMPCGVCEVECDGNRCKACNDLRQRIATMIKQRPGLEMPYNEDPEKRQNWHRQHESICTRLAASLEVYIEELHE